MPGKKKFDITAFIKGVERPTRVVELCMDRAKRERLDALMATLSLTPAVDAPLGGDSRREALMAELSAIRDDPDAWTRFTIVAPSNSTTTAYQLALAGEDDESTTEKFVNAKAVMIAECLTAIDGNDVAASVDDAHDMLTRWPNDLTEELVNAMFHLGGGMVTLPLSQRLSATLATPEPSES